MIKNILTKEKRLLQLYNLIYFLFVFSLVYIIGRVIKLDLNFVYQVLIVLITIFSLKYVLYRPLILPLLYLVGLIVSALVNKYIVEFVPGFLTRAGSFLQNIFNHLQGLESIAGENILAFWIIITILLGFFTSYFLFKRKKPWIILALYIPIFVYYWYSFVDLSLYYMTVFILSFIFLIGLNSYLEEISRISQSNKYNYREIYPLWIKSLLKYALAIIILAAIIPKSNDYIAWPWLNQIVREVYPGIDDLRSTEKYSRRSGDSSMFDFASTGFMGEHGRLGGPVNPSERLVMTVLSKEPLYLRGNVKESYNGYRWSSIEGDTKSYQLGNALVAISAREKTLYYEEPKDITITFRDMASRSLFAPYMPYQVFSNDENFLIMDENMVLRSNEPIYKNESYLVRALLPLSYDTLVEREVFASKLNLKNIDAYLQVPDIVSDRTYELTKNIVEGKETDYEKAVAIESYLRENFQYTLSPDQIPGNAEFLDHFLFEEQRGYCTYYASSMAIMLRIEGIPSRYVEGYLVKDQVEDGKYEVRSNNAHAWVEAFIEPAGWMRFEATPAFEGPERLDSLDLAQEDNAGPDYNLENDREEYLNELGPINLESENPSQYESDLDREEAEEEDLNLGQALYAILGLIIAILLIYIIRNIIILLRRRLDFYRLSKRDKLIYLYRDIVDIIAGLGYPQEAGETHYEYASRISYKFHDLNNLEIEEFTHLFVLAKYSHEEVSDRDLKALREYRKKLRRRLRKDLGLLKYTFRKFLSIKI